MFVIVIMQYRYGCGTKLLLIKMEKHKEKCPSAPNDSIINNAHQSSCDNHNDDSLLVGVDEINGPICGNATEGSKYDFTCQLSDDNDDNDDDVSCATTSSFETKKIQLPVPPNDDIIYTHQSTSSLVNEYKNTKSISSNQQDDLSSDDDEDNQVIYDKDYVSLESIAAAATREAALKTVKNFGTKGGVKSKDNKSYMRNLNNPSSPVSTMQCPHCLKRISRSELKEHLKVCQLRMELCP